MSKIKENKKQNEEKERVSYSELIGGEIETEHRGKILFETLYRKDFNNPLIYAVYPLDEENPQITYETELVDKKGYHYRPPYAFIEAFEHDLMKTASDVTEYKSTKELWQEGSNLIADYCALNQEVNFIATWLMFYLCSWDAFETSINVIIRGSHGKGKSRLEDMFRCLVPRALNACVCSSISVLFRVSAGLKPLILFDELTLSPKNPDFESFVAIWNAGFRAGSGVIRNEGKGNLKYKLKFFSLHSPKIAILKGPSPEQAFESRCLVITMPPGDRAGWELYIKRRREGVDILELGSEFKERAEAFKNKLLMWKFKNWNRLKTVTGEFVLPEKASMRLFQVLNPMLTVINNKQDNEKLFKYAQRGEKMRKGEETSELSIAIFKLIWRRLIGPLTDKLDLKTLMTELVEESTALGLDEVYKLTPQKIAYVVKHQLFLDTIRTADGLRIIADIERMIELASDLGLKDFIDEDIQNLVDTNRLENRPGFVKKKKVKKPINKIDMEKLNI